MGGISYSSISATAFKRHLDIEIVNKGMKKPNLTSLETKVLIMIHSKLLDRPSMNRMEEWLSNTDKLEIIGVESTSTSKLYDSLEEIEQHLQGLGYPFI